MPLKKLRLAKRKKTNSCLFLAIKSFMLKPGIFIPGEKEEKIFLFA
jgi:hypothetical protein